MPLKSLAWNSHSVSSKIHELSQFVDYHKIDLIFISETRLNDTQKFYLPYFNCYRVDRKYGGVAILIRETIPHIFHKKISHNLAEAISVKIFDSSSEFVVSSIYCSPNNTRTQASKFFNEVLISNHPSVIAGDFNAKSIAWNCINSCTKGRDLLKLCENNSYDIHAPDSTTIIPAHGNTLSVLDFVISRRIHGISEPHVHNDLSSDHHPITFEIPFHSSFPKLIKVPNWKKANWKKYQSIVDADIFELLNSTPSHNSPESVDQLVDNLTHIINKATDLSVPKKFPFKHRHPYSDRLKVLTTERNFYCNLYKRTLDPSFKSLRNQLNRLIRTEVTILSREMYDKRLANLQVKNNSLWEVTKSLKNKKRAIPPLKTPNSDLVFSDKKKAEALAQSFHKSHLITANSHSKYESLVEKSLSLVKNDILKAKQIASSSQNNPTNSNPIFAPILINKSKVKNTLKTLSNRKAPGSNNISNIVLKKLPENAIEVLTLIFNSCLKISYFPTAWKLGKICAIAKPGKDPSDPNNYRPISLLCNIGKVFERVILDLLLEHERENNIIIPEQFGFRSEHSTVHQILRITENASIGFNNRESTGMVLLDLENAFNSTWHDGLIHKMYHHKTPIPLMGVIASFLKDRKSYVTVNKSASEIFEVPAGVPQGSILSPHLFSIFVNDIPQPKDCQLAMYADDTAIYCKRPWKNIKSIRKILVRALETTSEYFGDWKIKLNDSKTEFIMFTRSSKMIQKLGSFKPSFRNKIFDWKSVVTYLGVNLDTKLTFKSHIDKVVNMTKGIVKTLYCLLKKNNTVSKHSKISVYRSIIRPIMTYACTIFNNCAFTHFKKLQIQQNKCLRLVLNSDRYTRITKLHSDSGIPTIRDFVDKLNRAFYERATSHTNRLINSLGKYTLDDVGRRVKHRLPLKI